MRKKLFLMRIHKVDNWQKAVNPMHVLVEKWVTGSSGHLAVKNELVDGQLLVFGRPVVKRFARCYWTVVLSVCLSVCPVCDVHALWPNGWTDQDETRHAGRPRPWPLCVR